MWFYGNIVNYFSAAFKKFKFKSAYVKNNDTKEYESKEDLIVEALLSQDELIYESGSDNKIEFYYDETAEGDRTIKTMDMRLNVEQLRDDLTVVTEPVLEENNK